MDLKVHLAHFARRYWHLKAPKHTSPYHRTQASSAKSDSFSVRLTQACRKLERRWRTSGLNVHHQAWKDHLLEYKAEIVSVRSQYFSQIIDNNQKSFHTINKLLKGNSSSNVPASDQLCNRFLDHFSSKIITSVASASAPRIPHFLSLWVMWFHNESCHFHSWSHTHRSV